MERLGLVTQLEAELERRISLGLLPEDGKLPSERTLASKYGVSRTTAREALLRLHARGLMQVHPGRRARAVVMEEAVRLENLSTALLGEGPSHPERYPLLAGYLELKRQVAVELLAACCEKASEAELERYLDSAALHPWTQCAMEALCSKDVKALRSRLPALLQASDERVLHALAPSCEAHGVASLLGAQRQAPEMEAEAHPILAKVPEVSEPAEALLNASQMAAASEPAEALFNASQVPEGREPAEPPITSAKALEVGQPAPELIQARGMGALWTNWSGHHTSLCEVPPEGAPPVPAPGTLGFTPSTAVLWPHSAEEDSWPSRARARAPGLT